MPSFVHTLPRSHFLFVGDASVRFEWYDPNDATAMLVVGDPTKPWIRHLSATHLHQGESATLPDGSQVRLLTATSGWAVVRITSEAVIRTQKQMQAAREASASGSASATA